MRGCATEVMEMEDVQGRRDVRAIPINKVGIKDIRHPVRVRDRSGGEQHTIATFNMYVGLPQHFKGTHMSRFVEILNSHDREITVDSFQDLLTEMHRRLNADEAHLEMQFPYFVMKEAPVSKVRSLMDYEVCFIGQSTGSDYRQTIQVRVPVTSLCPCSKSISRYGAHNQRSHVTVQVRANAWIWIEELIDLVEGEASSQLFGLLKRPDEKYVTEYAYDHPKFVEDMVRDVAARLKADRRVDWFSVASENFESIHNHSAYAMIEMDNHEG